MYHYPTPPGKSFIFFQFAVQMFHEKKNLFFREFHALTDPLILEFFSGLTEAKKVSAVL
jgi:hypothetical protein